MHVLMTTDTLGDVFDYTLALSSALAARGASVTLASMGKLPSAAQRAAAAATGAMLCESSYRLEWMDDPWSDVAQAGEWLLKLEQVFRPDVIHLDGYAHAALGWQAPVCVVAHSCVLSRWRAVHGEPAPWSYRQYRAETRRGLQAAAQVVAPTRAMADLLQHEHGFLPGLKVIYDGAPSLSGPAHAVRSSELPRAEGKEPFIFAAGRLSDPAKNVRALQQVAPALRWPIRIAGADAGPDAHASEHLPGISWLGPLSRAQLEQQLRRAAIFVAPVLYEPFGLAILEAASAGCALVLGDVPSLRELWTGAALFVDPRDPAALARTLDQLSDRTALRELMGARARERSQRYGVERMGRAYLALYQSLLSGNATAPAAAAPPPVAPHERAARAARSHPTVTEHRS